MGSLQNWSVLGTTVEGLSYHTSLSVLGEGKIRKTWALLIVLEIPRACGYWPAHLTVIPRRKWAACVCGTPVEEV